VQGKGFIDWLSRQKEAMSILILIRQWTRRVLRCSGPRGAVQRAMESSYIYVQMRIELNCEEQHKRLLNMPQRRAED
jgi:hypothetical protein